MDIRMSDIATIQFYSGVRIPPISGIKNKNRTIRGQ